MWLPAWSAIDDSFPLHNVSVSHMSRLEIWKWCVAGEATETVTHYGNISRLIPPSVGTTICCFV